MTYEEYLNSEEWRNCLAAIQKAERLKAIGGIVCTILCAPAAVFAIVLEMMPEEWIEEHPAFAITAFVCCGLIGVLFILMSVLMGTSGRGSSLIGQIAANTFRMQSLMAESMDVSKFYLCGSLSVRADLRLTDQNFKRKNADVQMITLVGERGTEQIKPPFQGRGSIEFIYGFLHLMMARFLVQLTEKGERVDVALVTSAVEGEPISIRTRGVGGLVFVRNGKLTLLGKNVFKRVKKLETKIAK